MGNFVCGICKEERSAFGNLINRWFKCSRHGVICNKCAVTSWFSKPKCPKCGNVLKPIET